MAPAGRAAAMIPSIAATATRPMRTALGGSLIVPHFGSGPLVWGRWVSATGHPVAPGSILSRRRGATDEIEIIDLTQYLMVSSLTRDP